MAIVFEKFQNLDDLILQPLKGRCSNIECVNVGCSGYSFLGNKSNNHLDLIFEEEDHDIVDIYHCNALNISDKSIKRAHLLYLDIKNDERADFKPSIEFLIKSQSCTLACEELDLYKHDFFDKDFYALWLKKYQRLYRSFKFPPIFEISYSVFYFLFQDINILMKWLENHHLAKEAVKHYDAINLKQELDLLKWLVKYENLGDDFTVLNYNLVKPNDDSNKGYFTVQDMKISYAEFEAIARFKPLFDNHYWEMLSRYTISKGEEYSKPMDSDSQDYKNSISLTFQLRNKGIID